MLQDTAERVTGARFAPPTIVCNEATRFLVAEQLRAIGVAPNSILLEPEGRNTLRRGRHIVRFDDEYGR